jgi:predicted dehydrogenase
MDRIKLGLVGFGEWGKNYFRSIGNVRIAELTSICKRDLSTVPNSIRKSVPVTTSLKQVLRKANGVVVATPPSTHREIACFFLEAGIPVLLEKPVAETLEDAEAIFEASARYNTAVLVNNIHLFSPSFLALRRAVESWEPMRLRSEGGNDGPFREHSSLLDYGPHDIAMAMAVAGSSPEGAEIFQIGSEAGELYNIRLYFERSEADLMIGNGMASKKRYFEVSCGSRMAIYDDIDEKDKFVLDGTPVKTVLTPPLDEAIHIFARTILDRDTDWRFSAGLNLDVMRILSLPLS